MLTLQPQFMDMAHTRVRYAKGPPAEGLPILLTAPWPESIHAFAPIWSDLCRLGSVIAIDLPGFGGSQAKEGLLSPSKMGGFVLEMLDTLGLHRVHAIAPDVGTLAILFAASQQPARFESIVGGSVGTRMALLADALVDIARSKRADFADRDGGDQVVALIRSIARVEIPEVILEDYRMSSQGQRWNIAADFVRAYPNELPLLEALLPHIDVPTLAISGSDDPFVPPSNGAFLAQAMPRCRSVVVEAGHFVWEDAPRRYADLIVEWIAERRYLDA